MPLQFSIIVCTYNRADILPICLQSLEEQNIDKSLYEVIIINNNSTDNTHKVAESFCNRVTNFHVFSEINQGLSFSRNRGLQEANSEYVVYIDDDCKVPKNWLLKASTLINNISPDVLGGPYFPFYNSPKPKWFKDEYGSHIISTLPKLVLPGEYLDGGNFFIRRNMLIEMNGFDTRLGMKGKELGYGEETALQIKIRSRFPDAIFYYDPDLFLYHLMRREKMSLAWIIKHNFSSGQYSTYVFWGSKPSKQLLIQSFRSDLKEGPIQLYRMLFNIFFQNREKYPYFQNYFYENGSHFFFTIGKIFETLKFLIFFLIS